MGFWCSESREDELDALDHRAESPDEAVALAWDLQAQSLYAYFRGQRRDWSLQPSLFRLAAADQERARERLERFLRWIRSTAGLEAIAANEDCVLAVAQHYGIPTTFLDFTKDPSVAAFFACHGSGAGDDPCIVCLEDAGIANAVWSAIPSERHAAVLSLEVPNLWRLEAQQGVFVDCPWNSLDDVRHHARIHFPPGDLGAPSEEEIYPPRKSQLEVLLDQYFHREEVFEFHRYAEEIDMQKLIWEMPEAGYRAEFFAPEGLAPLASWRPERIADWIDITTEHWRGATALGEVELRVEGDLWQARERVLRAVLEWLHDHPGARSSLVHWAPFGLDEPARARLKEAMLRTWDGMRTLPYVDDDIAEALAACAALVVAAADPEVRPWETAERCLGWCVRVEFQATDEAYSRALVGQADLLGALREDFFERVRPEYVADARADGEYLLLNAWTPQLVFEFEPLTRLFARQVIPCQVVFRPGEPVFFSPARLETFGRP